jgi:hypothetical protein
MIDFNGAFPHCATDDTTDMVGRTVRFRDPQMPRDGLMAIYGLYEVTGLQTIYNGDTAYRVKLVHYQGKPFNDTFGRPMQFEDAEFVKENNRVEK